MLSIADWNYADVTRQLNDAVSATGGAACHLLQMLWGYSAVRNNSLLTTCCAQGHDPMINSYHGVMNQPDPIENKGLAERTSHVTPACNF